MDRHLVLKRAMTIICSLMAMALLSDPTAFAQEAASGGSDTRNQDTSSTGTTDQTVGRRSGVVVGETDTTTTGGRQERRRERPRDVRRDDGGSGKQGSLPRLERGANSSLLKTRLDQSNTSIARTGNKNALKLKLQQPKPRTGPKPR